MQRTMIARDDTEQLRDSAQARPLAGVGLDHGGQALGEDLPRAPRARTPGPPYPQRGGGRGNLTSRRVRQGARAMAVEPGGFPTADRTGGRGASALHGDGDRFGLYDIVPKLNTRDFCQQCIGRFLRCVHALRCSARATYVARRAVETQGVLARSDPFYSYPPKDLRLIALHVRVLAQFVVEASRRFRDPLPYRLWETGTRPRRPVRYLR